MYSFNTAQIGSLNARGGGFFRDMIGWMIRVVIYDICITTIQEVTGVSRIVALFIFLGLMGAVAFIGYLLKQRLSPGVDE
jgi:hypothetical protein